MNPCTISCELHDYIEIACLYGYQVKLTLSTGECLIGKAIDIITADKREFWVIDSGEQLRIDLMQLAKIQVLTANAKFSELTLVTCMK
jgi:Rho-binding antiterminator